MSRPGKRPRKTVTPDQQLEAARAALDERLAVARGFLRAGGSLSWAEWLALPAEDRLVFAVAGQELAITRGLLLARMGREDPAAVAGVALEELISRCERALQSGCFEKGGHGRSA